MCTVETESGRQCGRVAHGSAGTRKGRSRQADISRAVKRSDQLARGYNQALVFLWKISGTLTPSWCVGNVLPVEHSSSRGHRSDGRESQPSCLAYIAGEVRGQPCSEYEVESHRRLSGQPTVGVLTRNTSSWPAGMHDGTATAWPSHECTRVEVYPTLRPRGHTVRETKIATREGYIGAMAIGLSGYIADLRDNLHE